MKVFIFILSSFICFLFKPLIAHSQGVNNLWIMGYESYGGLPWGNTILDFSSGSLSIMYDSLEMEFRHTSSTISDDLGNLLFYTNGIYIADATGDTMQNGSGLNPSGLTDAFPDGSIIPQAALILKKPGNNSIYYLIHGTEDFYPIPAGFALHLYLTTIDINGNGGLGTVIQKNLSLIDDSLNIGKITATKHANGRDWWVVIHRAFSNQFYKLLITPYSLPVISTQNIGPVKPPDLGQAKFSPDGLWYSYFSNGILDIYNFDRCSGLLSNHVQDILTDEGGNVGCEYSSYSNMLYVSNVNNVYQYTLGVNIIASRQLVATYDGFQDSIFPGINFDTRLCLPQLAPDGKIYITSGNSTRYFHTIHYPYLPGTFCNLVQHDLNVPTLYYNTTPNHPNYFLGTISGSACDSLTGTGDDELPAIMIKAWPNPANEFCTVSFPSHSNEGLLEIFDALGKKVFEELIPPWSQIKKIDLKNYPGGIYLFRLNWSGHSVSTKIYRE